LKIPINALGGKWMSKIIVQFLKIRRGRLDYHVDRKSRKHANVS
jgi:hypothetical protein